MITTIYFYYLARNKEFDERLSQDDTLNNVLAQTVPLKLQTFYRHVQIGDATRLSTDRL